MKNAGLMPSDGESWYNRIQQCYAQGDIPGALDIALGAAAADPGNPVALHTLAVLYLAADRAEDAVCSFRALLLQDVVAERYFELGVALEAAHNFSAARDAYRQALALESGHFKARLNLCALLLMQRLPEEARREALVLVEQHPMVPDAWCSLGHALFANFDPRAADAAFAKAQMLAPGHLPAALGRVVSLAMCGELARSAQLQAELAALQLPSDIVSAIPQAKESLELSDAGREDVFLVALFERFRRGEWECRPLLEQGLRRLAGGVREDPYRRVPSVHAFNALAMGIDYADYRVLACRVAAQDATAGQTVFSYPRRNNGASGRRLNLGFISPAFRDHPSAYLIRNTFRHYDRARFSVTAYCIGVDDGSEVRRDIINGCDSFVSLAALSDREAAQCIHDDGIDILVQFQGFFEGTRNGILHMRPAPVRVTHIGVVGALDATYIDYRFCEALADQFDAPTNPPGEDIFEKRVRFSELYSPYGAPLAPWSLTVTRRDFGLPEQAFVFCSFNTDYKINEEVFVVWLEILRATPASILWLRASNDGLWTRCLSCAESHGIAPERIVRALDCSNDQHLARMRLADLFLDSFAYNAHTTALDALWMGLPILTKEGQIPVSMLCAVFLKQLGLPELITRTTDEYIASAIALASDPARYQAIVGKLMSARSSSKVFDTPYKVRLYERAYETMWARHTAGLPPIDFDVPPLKG